MVTGTELFESPDITPLDFCLWDWMNGEVYKRKMDRPDELLPRNMDAATNITKREDQLRRTTHDLRTRVAKCTEADGGFFEHLFCTVTNLPFACNKFAI